MTTNTTTNPSRRSALTGLVAAAGIAALPAGAVEVDPVFALIAEHSAAVDAHGRAIDIEGKISSHAPEYKAAGAATREAMDRSHDLLWEVFHAQPTTLAGAAALLAHVGQPEFLREEPEYPDCRENFLSTFIHGEGEMKRAAQDFPIRLAETVRALIGAGRS